METLVIVLFFILAVNIPDCTGVVITNVNVTTEGQLILSPNYPASYPHNLDQRWEISTFDPAYRIAVNIIDFEVEDSRLCAYDKVIIWDGGIFHGTFCATKPSSFYSNSNNVSLSFTTDNTVNDRGFQIKVHATLTNPFIGGITTGEIVAIVIGVLTGIFIIVIGVCFLIKINQHKIQKVTTTAPPPTIQPPLTARQPLPPIKTTPRQMVTFYDSIDSMPGSIPSTFTYPHPHSKELYSSTRIGW